MTQLYTEYTDNHEYINQSRRLPSSEFHSKSIRMIRTTDVVIHVLYRLLNVCGLHTSSTFNYLTVQAVILLTSDLNLKQLYLIPFSWFRLIILDSHSTAEILGKSLEILKKYKEEFFIQRQRIYFPRNVWLNVRKKKITL